MRTQLPDALLQSADYLRLNERQAFNFKARISHINEIIDDIAKWHNGQKTYCADLSDFLDELELDVAVCQSINTGDDYESMWVIHSSWGDGADERPSHDKLPADVLASLDDELPKLNAEDTEVNAWLEGQGRALRRALETLSVANHPAEALSSMLALDILMAKFLASLFRLRFR